MGAWLVGRRALYTVAGSSMQPALHEGERVWVRKRHLDDVSVGAIIVARSPRPPPAVLVKRLRSRGEASFSVASDDPTSALDSRTLGSFPSAALVGEVTLVVDPQGQVRVPDPRQW